MSFEFQILRSDEGTPLGVVPNTCLGCSASYRLYGGCDTAQVSFMQPFNEAPVANKGDFVTVRRDGLQIFSGRVAVCEPSFGDTQQSISIDGWWKRLPEREAVSPPLLDHITFGQSSDSDHPTIVYAFDVMRWILENRILNDPDAMIYEGNVQRPQYPCKLAGEFVLYAKDDLSKVIETLATMEDCVTGIDSSGHFYYFPRDYVQGTLLTTVYAAKEVPVDWLSQNIAVAEGGGRFVYDRRGPNAMAVYSRDKYDQPSIRSYNLKDALPSSTKRTAGIRSANIHTGVQARRYARGLFRRFCDYSMKVEELSFRSATRSFEPHRGRFKIEGPGSIVYADKIAGQVNVNILRTTISGTVTIGENAADPASGNPINDPDAKAPGWDDDSQVNTGIGNGDRPVPSGDIDFNDGFDGDGDDLHQNDDREFPEDDPGLVDYGNDTRNPDNSPSGEGTASSIRIGIITAESHPSYSVDVLAVDSETVEKNESSVEMEPPGADRLLIGQRVLVSYLTPNRVILLGLMPARGMMLKIKEKKDQNKYDVEVLSPANGSTVIGTFDDCETWPLTASFEVGQETFGYWFNNAEKPTPVGVGGCCSDHYYFVGQVIKD